MKRRILSILIALALCLGMLPGTAGAEEGDAVSFDGQLSLTSSESPVDGDTMTGDDGIARVYYDGKWWIDGGKFTEGLGGMASFRDPGACYTVGENGLIFYDYDGEYDDPGPATLALVNVQYKGDIMLPSGVTEIKIVPKGTNQMGLIMSSIPTTVDGPGELNAFVANAGTVELLNCKVYGAAEWPQASRPLVGPGDNYATALTINAGATLTIKNGETLTFSDLSFFTIAETGKIDNQGTISINEGAIPEGKSASEVIKGMNLTGTGTVKVKTAEGEEFTYSNSGVMVVEGPLDFTKGDTPSSGAGYKWDADSKTLTLTDVAITGTVTLPTGDVTINVTGDCSINKLEFGSEYSTHLTVNGTGKLTVEEQINISSGNDPSLTVAEGATLEVKERVAVGASGGVDGTVTVNGTLIANVESGSAIYTGNVLVGSSGSLTTTGTVSLHGKHGNGDELDYTGAFTIEPGGRFASNYTGDVITVNANGSEPVFTDDNVNTILVFPAGYLPAGHEPTVNDAGTEIKIAGGDPFTISADNIPTPDTDGPSGVWPFLPIPTGVTPAGPTTYPVREDRSEHGTVTVSPKNAKEDETVTVTTTPDPGYTLTGLTVTDDRGETVRLTDQGGGVYTFPMPGRAVTVTAVFAPLPEEKACDGGPDCPSRNFTDVGGPGTWYHEAVDYVLREGLMSGYTGTAFGPDDPLSRAQFAQILYNMEGGPAVAGGIGFADTAPGQWYTPAVTWAAASGIVTGYGNGTFGPGNRITREQLAVMLWRYMGSPAAADRTLRFTDAGQASAYALDALYWAVENGVINGYGSGQLDPNGLATRAQAAQMLQNYLSK